MKNFTDTIEEIKNMVDHKLHQAGAVDVDDTKVYFAKGLLIPLSINTEDTEGNKEKHDTIHMLFYGNTSVFYRIGEPEDDSKPWICVSDYSPNWKSICFDFLKGIYSRHKSKTRECMFSKILMSNVDVKYCYKKDLSSKVVDVTLSL